jgi:hypothetical protein
MPDGLSVLLHSFFIFGRPGRFFGEAATPG